MTETSIRELESEEEWMAAFPVISQLRTHLDEESYLDYLRQMTADGYRLFGLLVDDQLAAMAGAGILLNMYYGRHLWIYELVTDADHRSQGLGEQLYRHLVEWAKARGCEKVALSSGIQRARAHEFYEDRVGMTRASYVFTQDIA